MHGWGPSTWPVIGLIRAGQRVEGIRVAGGRLARGEGPQEVG